VASWQQALLVLFVAFRHFKANGRRPTEVELLLGRVHLRFRFVLFEGTWSVVQTMGLLRTLPPIIHSPLEWPNIQVIRLDLTSALFAHQLQSSRLC